MSPFGRWRAALAQQKLPDAVVKALLISAALCLAYANLKNPLILMMATLVFFVSLASFRILVHMRPFAQSL